MAAAPPTRHNNFDLIRLGAAVAVVVSHAYPLSEGAGTPEPLAELSGHQASLGGVAVITFMALSGYLVTSSALRSPSLARFLAARVLRIYPALLAVVLLTVVVVGPMLTTATDYLQSETGRYLLNATGLRVTYTLPGLFVDNPYPAAVNGSLWTLEYELAMYALVAAGLGFGILRLGAILPLWIAALAFTAIAPSEPWAYFALAFLSGGVIVLARIPMRAAAAAVCALAIILATAAGVGMTLVLATCGAYLLVWLATSTRPIPITDRIGDLSYGTYLWAFPVQQTVALVTGSVAWWANAGLSLPIILALAALSWHLVERPALTWKRGGLQNIARELMPSR